jgi:2-oxoglutarate ferredoxin oxidoreductase subunit gamma
MHQEVLMAGAGGDGIMLIGQLLAHAAVLEGKNIVWFPSYGPESRGGPADCTVIISDDEIGSPITASPDVLIAMNQMQLDKYASKVRREGLIIINSALATPPEDRDDCRIISIAASEIAEAAGTVRASNMVMLGCYAGLAKPVKLESIVKSLPKVVPAHRHNLLPVNELALQRGSEAGLGK